MNRGEYMLAPDKVQNEAMQKENENYRFRAYLKGNADAEELDSQFVRLHNELFANYDCNKCRNCCKKCRGTIPVEDAWRVALHLNMTEEKFVNLYLEKDTEDEDEYQTKHIPCDFLMDDGNCKLGDFKPEGCKLYPFTNQPGRLFSLYSFLDAVSICPVAFEICERLKEEYNFKKRFR